MKIKSDFVTNSSSSSFVVMGSNITMRDIPKGKLRVAADHYGIEMSEMDDDDVLEDLFIHIVSQSMLEYTFGDPNSAYDDPAVGIKYTKMKEDQTLGEFKDIIKKEILEVFGINTEPYHIQMCWEDR